MIHATPQRREEKMVLRAEAQRTQRASAAQRPSFSRAVKEAIIAAADNGHKRNAPRPPRLCANQYFLFASSRPFGFAQDRLSVNNPSVGHTHV